MNWITEAIITGFTSFVATNIDDILVLVLFFSQINGVLRSRHIVLGQYFGFATLILLSIPGYIGGLFISEPWIGLLGFLPIIIGLKLLLSQEDDEVEVQTVTREVDEVAANRSLKPGLMGVLAPQTYQVAAVTVANGGDNIGIYVPLFASSSLAELGVILTVFFILVGVWCFIASRLVRHPTIAPLLSRYGHRIMPWVLIGLGLFILVENKSYQLLQR